MGWKTVIAALLFAIAAPAGAQGTAGHADFERDRMRMDRDRLEADRQRQYHHDPRFDHRYGDRRYEDHRRSDRRHGERYYYEDPRQYGGGTIGQNPVPDRRPPERPAPMIRKPSSVNQQ